jgi:uncharacterized protein (DUF488 family)
MDSLYTIGHSTHPIEKFIGLLKQHGILAVADVRSHPFSRHSPQFSKAPLKQSLQEAGITYVILGKELGARSENPACYRDGKAQYELLAKEPQFQDGLVRLRKGMEQYSIAIMCAERDPLGCHRAILVARKMHEAGTPVQHILADGNLETHFELESRMLKGLKMSDVDMFSSKEEILLSAYKSHGEKFAYYDESMLNEELAERSAP